VRIQRQALLLGPAEVGREHVVGARLAREQVDEAHALQRTNAQPVPPLTVVVTETDVTGGGVVPTGAAATAAA
jgi:hypothetical protein